MYLYDRDFDGHNNMILKYNAAIEGYWAHRAKVGSSDGLVVTGLW